MIDLDTSLERIRLARNDGRSEEARQEAEAAVAATRASEDRTAVARALCALGGCARDQRDTEVAKRCYAEATERYRAIGDGDRAAHALRHLADVFAGAGSFSEAEPLYREVLSLYDTLPKAAPLDVANALRSSAICYERTSRTSSARSAWLRARALYEVAGIAAGVEESARRLQALDA
jgi:tetratricopeptide (TPR) repeat protein